MHAPGSASGQAQGAPPPRLARNAGASGAPQKRGVFRDGNRLTDLQMLDSLSHVDMLQEATVPRLLRGPDGAELLLLRPLRPLSLLRLWPLCVGARAT